MTLVPGVVADALQFAECSPYTESFSTGRFKATFQKALITNVQADFLKSTGLVCGLHQQMTRMCIQTSFSGFGSECKQVTTPTLPCVHRSLAVPHSVAAAVEV